MTSASERWHGLDALRAWALLLGVLLHSTLTYVMPGGVWAVGTNEPSPTLGWLIYYLHSFRLEIFFLMAGFFGALVVDRRGTRAYVWDRLRRILLVFFVVLYPMKFVLGALWIAGGRTTGWLELPPLIDSLPWYALALGSAVLETRLTHLWFLYYLFWITLLALGVGWIARRVLASARAALARVDQLFESAMTGRLGSVVIAILLTPILATMQGLDVDTPDSSFAPNWPVMAVYGLWFTFGWWLFRHPSWLQIAAQRWRSLLVLGLLASLVGASLAAVRVTAGPWATAHADALRWAASFATSADDDAVGGGVDGTIRRALQSAVTPQPLRRRCVVLRLYRAPAGGRGPAGLVGARGAAVVDPGAADQRHHAGPVAHRVPLPGAIHLDRAWLNGRRAPREG